jgi:hypothetical protein
MSTTNVYLSVGKGYTKKRENFIVAFEEHLRANGLKPQTCGRSVIRNERPLKAIAECMRGCSGIVVLAFERIRVDRGFEKPGGPEEKSLKDVPLTTPWNQIEAGMAYALGLPLLVVAEKGLRQDGVLEEGHDWYVLSEPLNEKLFRKREFVGLLEDWKKAVRSHRPPIAAKPTSVAIDPLRKSPDKLKILFVAANPTAGKLELDEEIRKITEKLRASQFRDALELVPCLATRPDDLLQQLNQQRPTIVHFSGHGSDTGELIFVSDFREPKPVSPAALKALFTSLKDNVRLVVLNACYSVKQAKGIAKEIDCVVGMTRAVQDNTAIAFAANFYSALGFGKSITESFDQAKAAVLMESSTEGRTPVLLSRLGVDAGAIRLAGPTS